MSGRDLNGSNETRPAPSLPSSPLGTTEEKPAGSAEPLSRELLALIAPRRPGRVRRCGSCGLRYPQNELHPDFDEDGRRIGWTCDSCF